MNSACRHLIAGIVLIVALSVSPAGAGDGDRWFAKDKFQHFGYSAFLSGGSYIIANRHFHNDGENSFAIGVGFTLTLGAAKEVVDYKVPGQTSSLKDFIWDIAGALTGAAIASLAI